VRSTIKKDIWAFCLPAVLVYTTGLIVCAKGVFDRIAASMGDLDMLSVWSIAGFILCGTGLTISVIAALTLKRFYSSTLLTREDHQLIIHGIFRFSRHPVYFGTLMCMIGISVFTRSLPGFLIMLVIIPIFLNRIRMEENMLTGEFGDGYRAYAKSTKKLIPFIY
jgi:protein-S-isoprenylcysteine O-methyltransferase Ste14